MEIFTGYYASKKLNRDKHYLVRTSVGSARFCKCDEFFHVLAPHAEWIGLPEAEYKPLYIAMLEGYGEPVITELMKLLHDEAQDEGKAPVLLCFEALKKPGQFCHRRIFAEWYKAKTGVVISEL